MFCLQKWIVKLVYVGFASLFACLFTIIGMLATDVAAQRDKYGDIECKGLSIVDAKGDRRVDLGLTKSGEGGIWVYERKRSWFGENPHLATIQNGEHGGLAAVTAKDSESSSAANIGVSEYGGMIVLSGEFYRDVAIYINEYGNGVIDK